MKSYNHLWEEFISDENIELAIINLVKRKKKSKVYRLRFLRKSVTLKELRDNAKEYIPMVRWYASHFYNFKHKEKEIYDGITRKKRTIIVPAIEEQIVHHMIINILSKIWMPKMYAHSYGSLPKRGGQAGAKRIKKWIRKGGKNIKYCLKLDIHHFFASIDQDILLSMLRKQIHDEKFMHVLEVLVRATPKGLPLGFYTSQWFANWYLTKLDFYIKQVLLVPYHLRYMDDMSLFASSKKKLHQVIKTIEKYLNEELHLELKDNWQVFRFHNVKKVIGLETGETKQQDRYRFLDFMGYRFYRNRITLRKSIMVKMSRKARKIHKKAMATVYDCQQMLSALGWLKSSDTYNMYLANVKPYISFQKLKRKVSRHDKQKYMRLRMKIA